MTMNSKELKLCVPVDGSNMWVYITTDDPAVVEEIGYFNKAESTNGLAECDFIKVICKMGERKAVAEFVVEHATRNDVRVLRIMPWARTGVSPGADIPEREEDLLAIVLEAIRKLQGRPGNFRTDGRPNRARLTDRLGFSPSAEIVDKAMSQIWDEERRTEDARLAEKARLEAEAEAREQAKNRNHPPPADPPLDPELDPDGPEVDEEDSMKGSDEAEDAEEPSAPPAAPEPAAKDAFLG